MKIDFHSHLLPGIDDGARTPEKSVRILKYLKEHGIETVCATPHFAKHGEHVESFLADRAEASARLEDYIEKNGVDRSTLPKIVYGAEVHLFRNLTEREDLTKLCYTGSDCLLIELPFEKFDDWMLEEVYNIKYQFKVRPVMAHINRYLKLFSSEEFSNMFYNGDFLLQINCESALSFGTFGKVKKIIGGEDKVLLGCDIHDPDKFGEYGLEKTLKYIDKLPQDRKKELESLERSIFE